MCNPTIEKYGATPANVQWTVVRGDTARLTVQFLEDDETTYFDTEGWEYRATVYDPNGDLLDELIVETQESGDVTIIAPASITENWGTAFKSVVAELQFDLQVIIPETGEDTIWTPVIGTICVLGDITPGGSL
jgi:hypothetical protein